MVIIKRKGNEASGSSSQPKEHNRWTIHLPTAENKTMILEHGLVMHDGTTLRIELVHKHKITTDHRLKQDGNGRYAMTYTVEGANTDYGLKPRVEMELQSLQKLFEKGKRQAHERSTR